MSNSEKSSNYSKAFVVVTSLFFMWGFITVLVDFLIPRLKDVFELSYSQVILVQSAFFGAYFLVSIPAGQLLSKIGYKKGMLLGLATMGIGCLLFPLASNMRVFPVFLLGYFILASGMTMLQVAANPYVAVLGSPEKASSRLILSQAFNSVGTTIAPILGAIYFLSDSVKTSEQIEALTEVNRMEYYLSEASTVQGPFILLALSLIALAVFIAFSKLPVVLDKKVEGSYRNVLSNKRLILGAIGIFVYVGAEVSIGSFAVNYFNDMGLGDIVRDNNTMNGIATFLADIFGKDLGTMDDKGLLGLFLTFYWGGAMLGRFIGAFLTRVFSPSKILAIFGLGSIIMICTSMNSVGLVSMWSLLLVGLFNSIMFPTIFTLGIEELGDNKPKGSGVLCTAIVGGAIIPLLYGHFTDAAGFKIAFSLVIACYLYILYYGIYSSRNKAVIA